MRFLQELVYKYTVTYCKYWLGLVALILHPLVVNVIDQELQYKLVFHYGAELSASIASKRT